MRVGIVDDHEVVRRGLVAVLAEEPPYRVVSEATCGEEALVWARRTLPDVVVSEFRLRDMSGEELCRRFADRFPSTQVVILSAYLSEDIVQRALRAGAAGFVTKASGLGELRGVLKGLACGSCRLEQEGGSSGVVQRLFASASARSGVEYRLTPRQEQVLELAAEGRTYGQISRDLHVSESTVRFHIQSLKSRLGVRTRTELIALAIREALIVPDAGGRARELELLSA